jgi:CheY-like chemotaxis protein
MRSDILIVDDDADSRDAITHFLEKAGHSVRCAQDGREALEALCAAVPSLIVLDYRMPDMDGVTVLNVLRSYLRWSHVPVVMVTAFPEESRLWHVQDLGVERVFVKSQFRLDDLLSFIEERISRLPVPPEVIPAAEIEHH